MKKLKLTELNKNEQLEKETLSSIRGGSGTRCEPVPCCCTGSSWAFRRNRRCANLEQR